MMNEKDKGNAISEEMLSEVTGGSQADLDAFVALAKEKGWQTDNGLAGKMAAANMYKAAGMNTVMWNVDSGKPAVFIDKQGGIHSFEKIYQEMTSLPDK